MLVGEAPGRVSLEHGRPFSNPRSAIFRDALAALEHPRFRELEDLFYLTDLVKCHPAPPGRANANRTPSSHEVSTCVARFLTRELAAVGPSRVLAVGRLAARHLLGRPVRITDVHGRWYRHPGGVRVLPLMHPSPRNRRGLAQVGLASAEAYRRDLTRVFRALTRHIDGRDPVCP
jgi:DNA polymerase